VVRLPFTPVALWCERGEMTDYMPALKLHMRPEGVPGAILSLEEQLARAMVS
jgi:hypothetical protein